MKNGVQFINDYRYVDTYRNGIKIAGSKFIELSGESLSVSDTYNFDCSITINGKTIETGTGTKAPDNLYVLNSVSNFDLISTDGIQAQTLTLLHILRSIEVANTQSLYTYEVTDTQGIKHRFIADYVKIDNVTKTAKLVQNLREKNL